VVPQTPTHLTNDANFSFLSRWISQSCGFSVYRTIEGRFNVQLFHDDSGRVIREIDTSPSVTFGFFAPAAGRGFSYTGDATMFADYNADGRTAVVTLAGHQMMVHVPGQGRPLAVNAGKQVFSAVVLWMTPEGVPVVGFTEDDQVSTAGIFTPELVEAICGALTA